MAKDKSNIVCDGEFQKFKTHKKTKNGLHKKLKPRELADSKKIKKFF